MHIILVSNRLATARQLNVTPRLLLAVGFAFVVLSFVTSFLFSWVGARFNLPFIAELVESVQRIHTRKTDEYVRDNPWSSIGAAAALGLLVGVLLGRR